MFSKHAFREVPSGFRRSTVPVVPSVSAPRRRASYQPQGPRALWYFKLLAVKCLQGVQGDRAWTAPFPSNKNVLGTT